MNKLAMPAKFLYSKVIHLLNIANPKDVKKFKEPKHLPPQFSQTTFWDLDSL
jgi:hypothetical protein